MARADLTTLWAGESRSGQKSWPGDARIAVTGGPPLQTVSFIMARINIFEKVVEDPESDGGGGSGFGKVVAHGQCLHQYCLTHSGVERPPIC
jgi:hypothetical protein